MRSISTNYISNTALLVSNILFPLLTYPYATRILGPENIGKVNYFISLATYFVMIAALGIPLYGIRVIASVRENKEKLNKTFSELFVLSTTSTIIMLTIYLCLLFFPYISTDIKLHLIAALLVFLGAFSYDWLFSGLENYKFIAIRSVLIRLFVLIMLFVLVKNRTDYYWFAFLSITSLMGGNIINLFAFQKYIQFDFKNIRPFSHIKHLLSSWGINVISNIYLNLNVVMLGVICTAVQVGYFTTATKINALILSLISSLGTVLLPRLSYLASSGLNQDHQNLLIKSLNVTFLCALPATVILMFAAPHIIILFAGNQFERSVTLLQIIVPTIMISSLNSYIAFQFFYSQSKEIYVLLTVLIGSTINVILNTLLMRMFGDIGASISLLVTEFSMLTFLFAVAFKNLLPIFRKSSFIHYLLCTILIGLLAWLVPKTLNHPTALIIFGAIGLFYFFLLYISKDPITRQFINISKIMNKFKKQA